jgi:hypothetical protein
VVKVTQAETVTLSHMQQVVVVAQALLVETQVVVMVQLLVMVAQVAQV